MDFNSNVSSIKLSTWTYCAIANGTISNWNDPAITADNGTSVTGGTSEPITFYFRSDSAASTQNFTNHLNTACNVTWKKPYNKSPYQSAGHSAAWTFGVNSKWPGPGSSGDPNPNFIGEPEAIRASLPRFRARRSQPATSLAALRKGRESEESRPKRCFETESPVGSPSSSTRRYASPW